MTNTTQEELPPLALAAHAWCTRDTSGIEMDVRLAKAFADILVADREKRAQSAERVKELEDALHRISLDSKNSAGSREECGRIARAALTPKEKQ